MGRIWLRAGGGISVFLESIVWGVGDPVDHFESDPSAVNDAEKLLGWNIETTCSF
jgi:hypothetical protein